MKQTIKLKESELKRMIFESIKYALKDSEKEMNESNLNEGGIHSDNTPDEIIQDIESNFGNHSVTQMDSSRYVVGVDGKYGNYEIDVPANGHCRIKRYRYNSHNNAEDDQWYHYNPEWFNYCENNHSQNESINRKINRIVSECLRRNIR